VPATPASATTIASRIAEVGADTTALYAYLAALSTARNTAAAIASHVHPVACDWHTDPRSRRCNACGAQWIRLRPAGCHARAELNSAVHALNRLHKLRLVGRAWSESGPHFIWHRTPAGDAALRGEGAL